MPTTEHTINDALAEVLKQTRRCWQTDGVVKSENTRTVRGGSQRPDILIAEPNVSPVAVETEVLPASTVEAEALSRLGLRLSNTGRTIMSAIAVRLPVVLRKHQGTALRAAIRESDSIEMALYTGTTPTGASRLPRAGWITGNVDDLSVLIQHASVPPNIIDQAAAVLETGIFDAANILSEIAESQAGVVRRIGEELKQEDCAQTRRMAAAIMANAFVFHHGLARGPGELANVRTIEEMRGSGPGLSQPAVLTEWRKILAVNYWPIFDIARRILELLPPVVAHSVIERIAETADQLVENNLMRSHDLTGAVFQRLIADRKFLAAYYTTPAAAALLAGLAITPDNAPSGGQWSSASDLGKLRAADFACGTGTLPSIAYQRIGQLHELAGGDAEALHPQMMAEGVVGCDVLPAASHLTASMLAGSYPTKKYQRSQVLTVAYGKQAGGRIALGSLDLLDAQGRLEFDRITAQAADATGETEADAWLSLPHSSFDLVIMNPPFTRPTGHEAEKVGVPNPMFAAFGSAAEEQRQMAKALEPLTRGTSYHGNAGEASIFLVLGHRKLKTDGVLALVMPLSLLAGDSWEASRQLIARDYKKLVVVSIAGPKDFDVSFSADTGVGECLVVGCKANGRRTAERTNRATFVILSERPQYPLVGAQIARQIHRLIDAGDLHRIEDGPVGGTPIKVGDVVVGSALSAPLPQSGVWHLSRIIDLSLAQTAYQIVTEGRFWLPTMSKSSAPVAQMSTVGAIGKIGPYHMDIEAGTQATIRGPFKIEPVAGDSAPTYPVLWSHEADRERTMVFEADCEGKPITGKDEKQQETIAEKVEAINKTASHCHLNRDFRFNSQSTAMQFTDQRTIGGRAWLSISLDTKEQEKALVVWGNTTFGLLMYWWHSNKQQTGRGSIGVNAADGLPVLDVKKLPSEVLTKIAKIFDRMRGRRLLPVNEIDTDPERKELDEAFCRDVLKMDSAALAEGGPLDLLRRKLAREPSIHRGKKSRVGVQVVEEND